MELNDATEEASPDGVQGENPSPLNPSPRRPLPTLPGPVVDAIAQATRWPLGRILLATFRVFYRARGVSRAAEISYWGILSIIPFGAILLTVAAYAAGILLGGEWTPQAIAKEAGEFAYGILPTAREQVEQAVTGLLQTRGALGVFGSLALVVTSSVVFGAVRRALSDIFEVRSRGRRPSSLGGSVCLVAVVLVFLLGLPILNALTWMLGDELGDRGNWQRTWVHIGGDIITGVTFIFFVVYVVRVRVRWGLVLFGAAFFVLSSDLARWLLKLYMTRISQMNLVYGSLAGVMAALIWAYYVSISLLLTMSLLRVLQEK
ncbi:MAG: YihY/virulence factor BrkB family protein, partial [Myxococcota bacterium]|nr:YihY/virulence factor BrkB family protein [Myxococcota bacterium]